jgi:hypothetical protein
MRLKCIAHQGIIAVLSFSALLLTSCGNNSNKNSDDLAAGDSTQNAVVKINGEIFSVPSPIQFTFLIKKSGAVYSKEILNATNKSSQYSTNFSKALNLGIYGADLGYVIIYDQTQDAIAYLNSTKKIGDELGLVGVFDAPLIGRFTKNIGNQDSLLFLTSDAYRMGDAYLKDNDRMDVSALILAGGWIESLYLATCISKTKPNEDITMRIAEQKLSLQSVIKSLTQYNIEPELMDEFKDLSTVYDGVELNYVYEKPTTDPAKKMTTINSKTEVKITPEQIESITQKIKAIRNKIVG